MNLKFYDGNIPPNKDDINVINPVSPYDLGISKFPPFSKHIFNQYNLNIEQLSEEEQLKSVLELDMPIILSGYDEDAKSELLKKMYEVFNGNINIYGKENHNWIRGICIEASETKDNIFLKINDIEKLQSSAQQTALNLCVNRRYMDFYLPNNVKIVLSVKNINELKKINPLIYSWLDHFVVLEIKPRNLVDFASKNLHPLLCAVIMLMGDEQAMSYVSNLDKWKKASIVLEKTNNLYLIKNILGEDIYKYAQKVNSESFISLNKVINREYDDLIFSTNELFQKMFVCYLSLVDPDNLEVVRNFVISLNSELIDVFDNLWLRRNKDHEHILNELKATNNAFKMRYDK